MSECWSEGELRAYLDCELAATEQEAIAAHLKVCAECSGRYLKLAERAARVGNLMGMLPEPLPARARIASFRRKVAGATIAVLALAAALAIGFVVFPRGAKEAARVEAPSVKAPDPVTEPAPLVVAPAVIRHRVRQRPAGPVERADLYLPLDNEPIETGTVMRVGLQNSDLQAEFILGPDGRAHAIRVVSGK